MHCGVSATLGASRQSLSTPCVGGRPRFWTSSSNMAEQHHRTLAFRQKSAGKQGSILRGHRGCNRDAKAVQISQELGFRGDVGHLAFGGTTAAERSAARSPLSAPAGIRPETTG